MRGWTFDGAMPSSSVRSTSFATTRRGLASAPVTRAPGGGAGRVVQGSGAVPRTATVRSENPDAVVRLPGGGAGRAVRDEG